MLDWRTLVFVVARVCHVWRLAAKNPALSLSVALSPLFPHQFLTVVRVLGSHMRELALNLAPWGRRLVASVPIIASSLGNCRKLRVLSVVTRDIDFEQLFRTVSAPLESLHCHGEDTLFVWPYRTTTLIELTLVRVILRAGSLDLLVGLQELDLFSSQIGDDSLPVGLKKLTVRGQAISCTEMARACSGGTLEHINAYMRGGNANMILAMCQKSPRLQRLDIDATFLPVNWQALSNIARELQAACANLRAVSLRAMTVNGEMLECFNNAR
jgi:hypothetical protein